MIKLIASDMDGTLLNSEHFISDENVTAIKNAQKENIEFSIVTGRAYFETIDILKSNNIKASIIAMNGAISYDKKGEITNIFPLDKKNSLFIIKEAKKLNISFGVFNKNCFYLKNVKDYIDAFKNLIIDQGHTPNMKKITDEIKNRQKLGYIKEVTNPENYLDSKNNPVLKIDLMDDNSDKLIKLAKILKNNKEIFVTSSGSKNLEILSSKASKGKDLEIYCKNKNISLNNLMAIGDNTNDLSMIEKAYYSVAMKNANSILKQKAKFISDYDNNNSGVGRMIKKLIKQKL